MDPREVGERQYGGGHAWRRAPADIFALSASAASRFFEGQDASSPSAGMSWRAHEAPGENVPQRQESRRGPPAIWPSGVMRLGVRLASARETRVQADLGVRCPSVVRIVRDQPRRTQGRKEIALPPLPQAKSASPGRPAASAACAPVSGSSSSACHSATPRAPRRRRSSSRRGAAGERVARSGYHDCAWRRHPNANRRRTAAGSHVGFASAARDARCSCRPVTIRSSLRPAGGAVEIVARSQVE